MKEIINFKNSSLILLDQRFLPHKMTYARIKNVKAAAAAIKNMIVRGAPAIGIAAAYGYCLGCVEKEYSDIKLLKQYMSNVKEELLASRPTAVNLKWALDKMHEKLNSLDETSQQRIYERLIEAADKIKNNEIEANKMMGRFGAKVFKRISRKKGKLSILTHCNAGALATGGWGTAVGVIRSAFEENIVKMVYADETRPRLQGARLTCFELKDSEIPYTLICDNMAGFFMKQKKIDVVIVGADRIALNGDVANKIGTYSVAVLAKHHKIPFYVAAPKSTFDFNTLVGDDIEIETRPDKEVTVIGNEKICPDDTSVMNPAFDITPCKYITSYITEEGVIKKPDELQ